MNDLRNLVKNQVDTYIEEVYAIREQIFRESCKRCIPPIKGEITKRKIIKRDLKQISFGQKWWVEQGGQRVSPVVDGNKIVLSSLRFLLQGRLGTEEEINKEIEELRKEWER